MEVMWFFFSLFLVSEVSILKMEASVDVSQGFSSVRDQKVTNHVKKWGFESFLLIFWKKDFENISKSN